MRILHVIPTLGPKHGGPQASCLDLCSHLAEEGHDVHIYTTMWDAPAGLRAISDRGERWNGVAITFFDKWGPDYYWVSPGLWRALQSTVRGFDVVHIHSLYRFHLPAAAYFCVRNNVPYIVKVHGTLDPFLYKRKRFRKWPHEYLIEAPCLRNASAIQYTAKEEQVLAEQSWLLKKVGYGGHGVIVPNGVVIPEGVEEAGFADTPGAGELFKKFPELSDKDIVLFLSRINFKKGMDILIRAFGRIAREFPNGHLLIAGPDNEGYSSTVNGWIREEKLEGRVTFSGMLAGAIKGEAFRRAKVFVLPSYTENFGISIVEAMSYGVPVVISNKVNIHKEISEAGAGIVTNCDVDEVSTAVRKLLSDREHAKRMGGKGLSLVQDKFAWTKVAERMIVLYEELALAKRPAVQ